MDEAPSEDMIRYLESLGADRAALPQDPSELGALAFDLALSRDEELTMSEVAAAAGVGTDVVEDLYRTLGLTFEPGVRVFTAGDVALVSTLSDSVDGPLLADEGSQILRVAARGLTSIAEAGVAEVRQHVELRHEGIDDDIRTSAQLGDLAIRLGEGVGVALRHHLRQAAGRQRIGQQGVAERELMRVAVGFIDLVGFTGLTSKLPVEDLVDLVNTLERQSAEVAFDHDVRIVKIIGDEVMFVGLDPGRTCAFAIGFLDVIAPGRTNARGGLVFGQVLFRHGDYYGPVVNRAARLADVAVPGEILVDRSVAEIAGVEALGAGRRVLRGFDEPIDVFTLARQAVTS